MTPFERLIAQRPDPYELSEFQKEAGRRIRARMRHEENLEEQNGPDEITRYYLSHELSRKDAEIRYVVGWENDYVGGGTCILRMRIGPLLPGDVSEGETDLGTVLGEREYFEGADLYAVRDVGVRLSWAAACWLYCAARETLVAIHHQNGKRHGKLRPERIRFGLLHRHNAPDPIDEVAAPFNFPVGDWIQSLGSTGPLATDAERDDELATLAFAVAELTTHPEPALDRLLHDRGEHAVLAERLLERGEPVDPLLHDLLGTSGLEIGSCPDGDTIDDEFAALWRTVIELEPMIDKTKPGLWEIARA